VLRIDCIFVVIWRAGRGDFLIWDTLVFSWEKDVEKWTKETSYKFHKNSCKFSLILFIYLMMRRTAETKLQYLMQGTFLTPNK
jgi:hypothetical protein